MAKKRSLADPGIRSFWDARVANWDATRYSGKKDAMSKLHATARNPDESIQFRNKIVLEHLAPHIENKHIVEFGCGTGRLASALVERGAASYTGYDFAANAIIIAEQRTAEQGLQDRIRFTCAEVGEMRSIEADFVFSMGLLSWIPLTMIDHLFTVTREMHFLHNFSEKRLSWRQAVKFVHSRFISPGEFHPRSRPYDVIADIPKRLGWKTVYDLRHAKLYDAMCISSLPFPDSLKQ
jgi:2-polyprenyl-3-methyl-5-hydroxy-6-metoxy-1,4-benzoquinol methylase